MAIPEVHIGKFDTLATHTYAKALLDGDEDGVPPSILAWRHTM